MVGALIVTVGFCAAIGCSEEEPSGPLGLEPLEEIDQGDEIPKDASFEEVQALLDEKVDKGLISKEHAQRVLKVVESADAHNQRLERMDQQLFGEDAY